VITGTNLSRADLHAAIRAWAKGMYPLEAGAELLCRTGWAGRIDRSGYVELSEDGKRAWPKVGEFLQAAGYLSGGECRQVRLIASFLGQQQGLYDDGEDGDPRNRTVLENDLPGTDHDFIRLVQVAVGHAAGLHEHGGNPLPWPEES
jgi:hypothetical protein